MLSCHVWGLLHLGATHQTSKRTHTGESHPNVLLVAHALRFQSPAFSFKTVSPLRDATFVVVFALPCGIHVVVSIRGCRKAGTNGPQLCKGEESWEVVRFRKSSEGGLGN